MSEYFAANNTRRYFGKQCFQNTFDVDCTIEIISTESGVLKLSLISEREVICKNIGRDINNSRKWSFIGRSLSSVYIFHQTEYTAVESSVLKLLRLFQYFGFL